MTGRRLPRRRAAGLAALLLAAALAAGAQQDPPPAAGLGVDASAVLGTPQGPPLSGAELDRRTEELAAIMRCPVCQALSVADSPTLSAQAMKRETRELLAAGYSRDQVLTYFEQSYGEFIRLQPRARGFNLLVWLAPGLALVAGAVIIAGYLRSRRPSPVAPVAAGGDLETYLDRVRREVRA